MTGSSCQQLEAGSPTPAQQIATEVMNMEKRSTLQPITRRSLLSGLTGLAALGCLPSTPGAQPAELVSVPADNLVEFISVQTHLNWRNTVWENAAWRKLLGELGVRYTRSALGNRLAREHLDSVFGDYGIRSSATFNAINEDGTFDIGKTDDMLAFLKDKVGPEKISAVEGPNEYTRKHKHGDWVERLRTYQQYLHNAVKSDPALKHIDVLAPTIWKRVIADYEAIGDLGESADFGNLHLYNGGRKPSLFNRNERDEPIDAAIADARIVVPGKPIWITETGFNVAGGDDATRWTVPADIAAKYTLRNIGELFLRRDVVRRINIYSLIDDEHKDDHFGLLDASLSPRPAYSALKNLIGLFKDPGPALPPAPLSIEIASSTPDVKKLLFQKRDGRFLLMLWQDAESFDRATAAAVAIDPLPVAISFGRKIGTVRTFFPTFGETVQGEISNVSDATFEVPDHVCVLELTM
jgi:hypothetical protein